MGRAGTALKPHPRVDSPWGRPGGSPKGPPPSAEVKRKPWEMGQPGRCFLIPKPFPPGHKPSSLELLNSVSPLAEPEVYLEGISR